MATSGLVIFPEGLTRSGALNAAFSGREVQKRYVAVVQGQVSGMQSGWQTVDLPIQVDWPNRPLRVIHRDGKPRCDRYRPLHYDAASNTTHLELEPVTGRSHQLRVHLQAIGHPILGDTLYAPPPVQASSPRLLLHATQLTLRHPQDNSLMTWDCPAEFKCLPSA